MSLSFFIFLFFFFRKKRDLANFWIAKIAERTKTLFCGPNRRQSRRPSVLFATEYAIEGEPIE
jgi:hypothetical protein